MGVMGLTTFVNRSKGSGSRCLLRDISLVVDGSSLLAQLYCVSSARRRSSFNGDYNLIETMFYKFFQALRRCNIECYVICDGSYDKRKLNTAIDRLQSRIRDAALINPKSLEIPDLLIFPLLLKDVFFHVMTVSKVKFVVCEQEADQEIAIVARYLNVPVLSYDSDFYIYNVSYIPLKSINLKSPITLEDGKPALDCEMCEAGDFAKRYKIKPDLLPLLSTLLGNDYVKRSTFSRFFKNLSLHSRKTKVSLGQNRIYSLIDWLKNEDFDSAVTKVLDRFKLHKRQHILNLINASCKAYTKTHCKCLFDLKIVKELHEDDSNSNNDNDFLDSEDDFTNSLIEQEPNVDNSAYPMWFMKLMKIGKISPRYFELLKYRIYISSPQVENIHLEDACTLSFSILRYSFDLLTKFTYNGDIFYVGREYKKVTKIPICKNIKSPKNLCSKLHNGSIVPCEDFFFYFLEQSISKSTLNDIHKHNPKIQILILTIIWIKTQTSGKLLLDDSHICCLLLHGIISANISSAYDIEKGKFNIPKEEFKSATNLLSTYFKTNELLYTNLKSYDIKIVHEFAQFQCCLQQLNNLNILTSEPFTSYVISQTYNGTFFYNLHSKLNKKDDVLLYTSNILKDSPLLSSYIISLINYINSVSIKKSHKFYYSTKIKYYFGMIALFVIFYIFFFIDQ